MLSLIKLLCLGVSFSLYPCQIHSDTVSDCLDAAPTHDYVLNYTTGDNYLNIEYDMDNITNNYFIVIGDWGASTSQLLGGDPDYFNCSRKSQIKVGKLIKEFVASQEAKNKTLLFFVLLGDNFYYYGNNGDDDTWQRQWIDIYGEYLTSNYTWFSQMGNHDWLNDDPYAMCPWHNTKEYVNVPNPKDGTTVSMPYGSNQLNSDKGGTAPEKYHMPDYSYYYTINDLGLELIMFDANGERCCQDNSNTEIYWTLYDSIPMGNASFLNCCNGTNVTDGTVNINRQVAQTWLKKLKNASYDMMIQRAKNSTNHNFILANHYVKQGESWLKNFSEYRENFTQYFNYTNFATKSYLHDHNNEIVVSIFGHDHDQEIKGYGIDWLYNIYPNRILSGGGGGCCEIWSNLDGSNGASRGFYVFEFNENGDLHQPYNITDNKTYFEYDFETECNNCSADDVCPVRVNQFEFCTDADLCADIREFFNTTIDITIPDDTKSTNYLNISQYLTTSETDSDSGNKLQLKIVNVFISCVLLLIVKKCSI